MNATGRGGASARSSQFLGEASHGFLHVGEIELARTLVGG